MKPAISYRCSFCLGNPGFGYFYFAFFFFQLPNPVFFCQYFKDVIAWCTGMSRG